MEYPPSSKHGCGLSMVLRRHCWTLVCAVAALATCMPAPEAAAAKQTVCTVTVNSPDEKDTFRRYLSADRFEFVELVERGRADWLESACRAGVRCDVLVISGHYDGIGEFFSEYVEADEYLPVGELERASCSDSCPALFSRLKEVYLFGCNTLNPEAQRTASGEIARSLARAGYARADAKRFMHALVARHGASSRDRMRQVFKNVPVIYGFSSVAPLGPTAAATLSRYFQQTGAGEIGTGRASRRLLAQFSAHGLSAARGLTDVDPGADVRRDVCRFADTRMAAADRAHFVHKLLQRPMAEVRMFLEQLEGYAASAAGGDAGNEFAQAKAAIAGDSAARARFLDFARDADEPAVRVRMLDVAQALGWLSPAEQRAEIVRMIGELLARQDAGPADVDLVCTLNRHGDLDGELVSAASPGSVAHTAIHACLGGPEARAQTIGALVAGGDAEVEVARAYLRHRPIDDVGDLRAITTGIAHMAGTDAQVRALQALSGHRVADPESLESLARLFSVADSWRVQNAIAGVLIRADFSALARPDVLTTLRQHRLKSPHGDDVIDALIRRLEAS
jgi:hypothetical protein